MAEATDLAAFLSKASGRMRPGERGFIQALNLLAADMSIAGVIFFTPWSKAPRKMPGKTRTLLIWFGKSDLPVATINAPAFFAKMGFISGSGLASAKITGLGFIYFSIWLESAPLTLTPTNTSAFFRASASAPFLLSGFVNLASYNLCGARFFLPL